MITGKRASTSRVGGLAREPFGSDITAVLGSVPEILTFGGNTAFIKELTARLNDQGCKVKGVNCHEQVRSALSRLKPNLALIDAGLFGELAIEACRYVRKRDPEIVIIMFAADASEKEKLLGFAAGADDYLTAPFEYRELVARMISKLRRTRQVKKRRTIDVGNFRFEPVCHEATLAGRQLRLRLRSSAYSLPWLRSRGRS